jgi:hypothetical protein
MSMKIAACSQVGAIIYQQNLMHQIAAWAQSLKYRIERRLHTFGIDSLSAMAPSRLIQAGINLMALNQALQGWFSEL